MTKDKYSEQLAKVIKEYDSVRSISVLNNLSDMLNMSERTDLQVRIVSAIERAAGRNSVYYKRAKKHKNLAVQIGIAKGLLSDIGNGYTDSFQELVHGEVFGDFIQMSEFLLNSGFKDAAAVIAGTTLEVHLRKLCVKNGVSIGRKNRNKPPSVMNKDLASQNIYSNLYQKSVTTWLKLRNYAAHGMYDNYTENQVRLKIEGIKDFIDQHPA